MIRLDHKQGTRAWIEAKLGVPSASNFDRIVSPKTGKMLAGGETYLRELIAEWLLGEPLVDDTFGFMARGTAMEQEAVAFYEMERECETEETGFILTDDRRVGCSPDRLVGHNGGLEIKCPKASTHVGYLLGNPGEAYRCQIQGCLWVTEREWWDFVSYNPEMPLCWARHERDEPFIAALAAGVRTFCEQLDDAKATLLERGYQPKLAASSRCKCGHGYGFHERGGFCTHPLDKCFCQKFDPQSVTTEVTT